MPPPPPPLRVIALRLHNAMEVKVCLSIPVRDSAQSTDLLMTFNLLCKIIVFLRWRSCCIYKVPIFQISSTCQIYF